MTFQRSFVFRITRSKTLKTGNCPSLALPFSLPLTSDTALSQILRNHTAPFVNNNQNSGRVPRPNKSQNFGRPGIRDGGVCHFSPPRTPLGRPREGAAAAPSPNGSLYFFGVAFRRLTSCRTCSSESARGMRVRGCFFAFFSV